jgi:O-methyltransferase
MLDVYKCWDLWDIVGQLDTLDEGGVIELGAWKGGSAYLLQERMHQFDMGPLTVCDMHIERISRDLLHRNFTTIWKASFPHELPDIGPLRMVHLDVNVYETTMLYEEFLWEKLVPGGVVIYDDYGSEMCKGVTMYVDSLKEMTDRMVLYNLNGHAVVIKLGEM